MGTFRSTHSQERSLTHLCHHLGGMWLTDNLPLRRNSDSKNAWYRFSAGWAVFLVVGGAFICVAGSYGSIMGIIDTYATSPGQSFSCADNSAS